MANSSNLPRQALEKLAGASPKIEHSHALVGLDGFVDTIIHVVATRTSAAHYQRMEQMTEFGGRITAAAGFSANFEFQTQQIKLGGNGPIMANALVSFGQEVTYLGNLGHPHLHPIFSEFGTQARVISIAEPGYTDAIEFNDGKLMFGKHAGLQDVDWANILRHLPLPDLIDRIQKAALVALVNWTMLPHMTDILQRLLVEVAPQVTGPKRWLFFDLADPAKRTREDLAEALGLMAKFQPYFKVIVGLNLHESRQVGELYGIPNCAETFESVAKHAAALQKCLAIETVVIHPTHFAAAADATDSAAVGGPFTSKPKISTGAGDHFNAGFCLGRLLDCNLELSLQFGVATSGFYVRNAASPTLADLKTFFQELVAEAG